MDNPIQKWATGNINWADPLKMGQGAMCNFAIENGARDNMGYPYFVPFHLIAVLVCQTCEISLVVYISTSLHV